MNTIRSQNAKTRTRIKGMTDHGWENDLGFYILKCTFGRTPRPPEQAHIADHSMRMGLQGATLLFEI